jgi:MoaA/NifB/PqqE/SkfB family radical SAM enzyme
MNSDVRSYILYLLKLWDRKKFKNVVVNTSSYYLSRFTQKYFVWGKPFSFIIEPTNLCNLRCPECPVGLQTLERPIGLMRNPEYQKALDDIEKYCWYLLLYFQGESFINPDIIDMINYAFEKKMYTVISTNANRLASSKFSDELAASKLGRLVLSIDGATDETYTIYRQAGKFNRVIKGIEYFVKARNKLNKKFPRIILQFIVMKHNEHEMKAIKELGKKLGVDRVIYKSPQVLDPSRADEIMPQNPKFRRYEKSNGTYKLKGSYTGYCKKIWYGSVLTWDRTVIPCCFDKDAEFPLGTMKDQDFKTIWDTEVYHEFRKGVIKDRDGLEMCRNCTEGLRIIFH